MAQSRLLITCLNRYANQVTPLCLDLIFWWENGTIMNLLSHSVYREGPFLLLSFVSMALAWGGWSISGNGWT